MSQKVNVPDPVHDRLKEEKEARDIPMGAIVEEWMRDADRLAEIQEDFKTAMRLRGGGDE